MSKQSNKFFLFDNVYTKIVLVEKIFKTIKISGKKTNSIWYNNLIGAKFFVRNCVSYEDLIGIYGTVYLKKIQMTK